MTEYIVTEDAKIITLSGETGLRRGSVLEDRGGMLFRDGRMLFRANSENAFRYTARNDDGKGEERGALIGAIKRRLAKRDADHQKRWDRIWADPLARSFRMEDGQEEMFVWGFKFYNASIPALEHIAALIGARETK